MILTSRSSNFFKTAAMLSKANYILYPYIAFGFTSLTKNEFNSSTFDMESFIHDSSNLFSPRRLNIFNKIKLCYANRTDNSSFDTMVRNIPVKYVIPESSSLLDNQDSVFDSTIHTWDKNNQYYIYLENTMIANDIGNSSMNLIYIGLVTNNITYSNILGGSLNFYPIMVEYLATSIDLSAQNNLSFQYLLGV